MSVSFQHLPTDVLRLLLLSLRPIDMYQVIFASSTLRKLVLKIFPDLNLKYWMKVHTRCDRLDELFELMGDHQDQVFIFGSSLFAALRGSDWSTVRKYVHDLDFLSLQRVENPRSFAARTREFPPQLMEWDGESPLTPYVSSGQYYLGSKTTGAISNSFPQGFPDIQVIEIALGYSAEDVVMFSEIDFLHNFWDGNNVPKIRFPSRVQRGENTQRIVITGQVNRHLRKWMAKATYGLCTLNVTYGKL